MIENLEAMNLSKNITFLDKLHLNLNPAISNGRKLLKRIWKTKLRTHAFITGTINYWNKCRTM